MSAHKDVVGQVMHRWKHGDPKSLHSGRGKKGKEGKVVKSKDQAIAIALSMAGKSKDHAERLISMGYSEGVAQEVASMLDSAYDFTTCERPNGSRYGTAGKCRKGSEVSTEQSTAKKSSQATLDNLLKQEQEARDKGDTETARKLMREHMDLAKKLDSAAATVLPKSKVPPKGERPSVQQIQLEKLQDRLDDAVTAMEQQRISTAIRELTKRMDSDEKTRTASEKTAVNLSPKEVFEHFSSRVKALKVNRDEEIRRPNGSLIGDSPRNARIKVIQELYERLPKSRSESETKFLKDSLEKGLSALEG